ncbi:MAG: HEAT repeat domain-containing protein [Anaerolineales bacterium]
MPRFPTIDMLSFWIGAIVASVVWGALMLIRPLLGQILAGAREKSKQRQLQASAGIEGVYRKMLHRQTQGMHLAASLFALDEVVEPQLLLAPPPFIEPGVPIPRMDTVEQCLPYLLTWPELASVYHAPSLTFPEALSGGMNLILVGQPGAGKTVALAHLASQIVNRAPQVESLHENIPFLIHAADLNLPFAETAKPYDLIEPIVRLVEDGSSVFNAARMPDFVEYAFRSGRALLLLDGVDELPQAAMQDVAGYLRALLKAFPTIRVITTAGQEFANGIPGLGFAPLALLPWTDEQRRRFLERWADLWKNYVAVEAWALAATEPVDTLLLNRWLGSDNFGLTPLEFTLKVWAAYAGDARGARAVDAIDAHLRRLMPVNTPVDALHTIGAQASLKGVSIFDARSAREWTKSFEPAEPTPEEMVEGGAASLETDGAAGVIAPEPAKGAKKDQKKGKAPAATSARSGLIGQLTANGILSAHADNRLRFAHPIFMGFLAGKGLRGPGVAETLLGQPAWSGQVTAMRYVAAFGDASALVNGLLAMDDPMLHRPSLSAARLLREAPRNAPWRAALMSNLAGILQGEDQPIGLRGQVMAAFALSGDPNIAVLFRQLMQVPFSELQRLGALGAGALADAKSVEALATVISHSNGPARQAACLALVHIGTPQALELIGTALLHGDEQLRIAAAEALANYPGEGHDALREGMTSQDILVRRAAIYGLARVNEPWTVELLDRAQVDDEQWAVRSAAVEIMEARERPNPHVQRRLTTPSETPWLIEFAGKHGQGITPGVPATDVFLLAFKDEKLEVRSAALNYLRYTPTEGVLGQLYQQFYGGDAETKEEIYRALSEIAYNGTALIHPMQFGLG